ncbi:MAG TPA: sugar transferase [Microbacterium sp.]|uniref:sugar transferase n=1 Tax=Microbacterium sp. TaxID=51671 RepID=UPI002CDD6A44|nr:sugar transferase [Microbacterium sp.]HWI31659.1 sugar transferase [Microbacterium sp.]
MAVITATEDRMQVPEEPPSALAPLEEATTTSYRDRWEKAYARLLVVTDTLVIIACLLTVTIAGSQPYTLPFLHGRGEVSVWLIVGALIATLLVLLSLSGSRSPRVVGVGSQEYRAIVQSSFLAFTTLALLAYVTSLAGLHFILAAGLLATMPSLILSRWLCRRWLVTQRRAGRMSHRVLLIGAEDSIAATARDLKRTPAAGLLVVGACTPSGRVADHIPGTDIAISGSVTNVLEALQRVEADTVLITSANELSAETVRWLSWQLEPGRQHLIVAPSLTDIGGPRLHTRPVAGLPLVHVETPRYGGGKLVTKRAFDLVASGVLIVLLAPVLLISAVMVKFTSPGGVFFRQDRVGLSGDHFDMLKFRSMYVDAEDRLAELQHEARDRGNDVMFKMKDDPRVTPVGRFLRRFSLDELPQLFNVLMGKMSLVGPRPPLDREVRQYSKSVHRRFLVKPGITGLWQVSGRSDLDWDETVRLDLFYVENWTLTGDLMILLKTVKAVLQSDGAY